MPWHLGGDETLTYGEIDAYTRAAKDLNDARKKQAREARSRRRR